MLKFISLGCKVNSYESNALKELFLLNGFKENGEYDYVDNEKEDKTDRKTTVGNAIVIDEEEVK